MQRLFPRRSRKVVYPARRCHFCNVESYIIPPHPDSIGNSGQDAAASSSTSAPSQGETSSNGSDGRREEARLSTGSTANWFCSTCQCWNRSDEKEIGGISSWEVAMSDEKQNAPIARIVSSSSASSWPSQSPHRPRLVSMGETSPFCHSCQTNQTLILSILANLSEEEMETMSKEEMMAWQVSLEERYPPVCERCQDVVKTKIERADRIARRLIWNGWLKKSEERKRRKADAREGIEASPNGHQHLRSIGAFLWCTQLLSFFLGIMIGISSIWYPPASGSHWHSARLAVLCGCHMISWSWDPTLPQQLHMRQRRSPELQLKVEGLDAFRTSQLWLLIIGIFSQLCGSSRWSKFVFSSNDDMNLYQSTLFASLQLVIAYAAFRRLHVVEPISISLKTRPTSAPETPIRNVSSRGINESAALNLLSLDEGTPQRNGSRFDVANKQGEFEAEEEVQMDWMPTLESSGGPFSSSASKVDRHFQLGPQRFFEPVRKTGLEDLFGQTLALSDQRPAVADTLTITRGTSSSPFVFFFWSVTALIAFLALFIAFLLASDPHRKIFTELYLYGTSSARYITTQAFSLPQRLIAKLYSYVL